MYIGAEALVKENPEVIEALTEEEWIDECFDKLFNAGKKREKEALQKGESE